MADYLPAIVYVLANEGGYCNNPNDPGGATNFGILQREWPDGSVEDMTRDQAISWYQPNYWSKAPYGAITSQKIATKLLDMHVNCGLTTAVMIAQKAVGFSGTEVDGDIGPATLGAINAADESTFLSETVELLTLHYKLLEQQNARLVAFDRGWCARAARLPDGTSVEATVAA